MLREMTRSGCICRIRRRKYQSYKGEAGKTAPNVLKRNFRARKPNTKWGTDVTEFKVAGVQSGRPEEGQPQSFDGDGH